MSFYCFLAYKQKKKKTTRSLFTSFLLLFSENEKIETNLINRDKYKLGWSQLKGGKRHSEQV